MSSWISVEDRYPEDDELVLVCYGVGYWKEIAVADYHSKKKVWYGCNCTDCGNVPLIEDVTHWQSLPQLP